MTIIMIRNSGLETVGAYQCSYCRFCAFVLLSAVKNVILLDNYIFKLNL